MVEEKARIALEKAENKTEEMKARAEAIDELMEAGTLEDLIGSRDKIERELARISAQNSVEAELSRLKTEAGKVPEHVKSGGEGKSSEEGKNV
jgi:phage shock protein A